MEKYVDEGLHELVSHGDNEFKAAIYRDSYHWCKSRFYYTHYHEEYEIIAAVEGPIRIDVGSNTYLLEEHEFLLVNSNNIHTIVHDPYPESKCYTYLFHPEILHTEGSSLIEGSIIEPLMARDFDAVKIQNEELYGDLYRVDQEKENKDRGYPLDYLITIYKIISYVYRNYDVLNPARTSTSGNERIQKALSYIYSEYPKAITVDDIAKAMNLSKGEASRLFRKMTGKSIMDYIITYRINRACYYLKSTDKSITDIAFSCGFSSSNYFTIAFKKVYGITPKEFRKS